MIVIAATLIGALMGAMTARRRNGSRWDIAQYAAVYAIACALLGLIATLILHRNLV